MRFGIHVNWVKQDGMSRAKMVALPFWPFDSYSLNELYRGKLVRSITLIPFEIV